MKFNWGANQQNIFENAVTNFLLTEKLKPGSKKY